MDKVRFDSWARNILCASVAAASALSYGQYAPTIRLEERLNDSAYLANSTPTALTNNLHALRVVFKEPPGSDGYPYASASATTYYLKADSGIGIGSGATVAYYASMPAGFTWWTGPTYSVTCQAGQTVSLVLASSESLGSATLKVFAIRTNFYTNKSTNPPTGSSDWSANYIEYPIGKIAATAASIDTRKTFGQPNQEGELPGDANAPPSEINFNNWIHKGGLFVGNAPWNYNDQSGLSRIQISSPGDTGVKVAILSLFQQGYNSRFTDSLNVGVYFPASTDPNLSVGASEARWPTRWNIAPRASAGSPPDYTKDPYQPYNEETYKVRNLNQGTFNPSTGSFTPGQFVWWPLSENNLSGESIPAGALTRIVLAVNNEQAWVDGGGKGWRYFASEAFAALQSGKLADTAPRIWTLKTANLTSAGSGMGFFPGWN